MNEEVQKKRLNRKSKKLIIVLFFTMAFFVVITYAWFIGLSVAKVNTFEIKITTTEGLSLSLDGLNFYDEINLGNTENEILETVLNAYPNNPNSWLGVNQTKWNAPGSDETTLENKKTTDLLPVSTNGLIDQNGSVLTLFSKSSMTSTEGGYSLTSDRYLNKIDASGTYIPDEQKGYITFNLFIKNNDNTKYINAYNMFNDEDVYLSTDSKVMLVQSSEYDGESSGGDGLENSLRIAFMQIGRVDANSTQDVVTSITCTTTNIVTGLCNAYSKVTDTEQPDGTYYQKDTDVYESNFNTFAIWEPNDLEHTASSMDHFNRLCKNRNLDGSYTNTMCNYTIGSYVNTYTVRNKIVASDNVDIYDGLNNYNEHVSDDTTKKLQKMRYYRDTNNRSGDTRERLFFLAPNSITLVKVYIYLEGQDIDNYDIASIGKSFAINFGFTKDRYEEERRNNIKYVSPGSTGDINRDGVIDDNDVDILIDYINTLDIGEYEDTIFITGDLNKDGSINGKDSVILKRYLDGIIMSFDETNNDSITLSSTIIESSIGSSNTVNFNVSSQYAEEHPLEITTGNTPGLYQLADNSNIYFYRGNVQNNNVLFANFCWRILRTTENGGIKLVYNGIPSTGTCPMVTGSAATIGNSVYNSVDNDKKYGGYTYIDGGAFVDSTIKTYIDSWYRDNLLSYTNYLEDTVFCNETGEISLNDPNLAVQWFDVPFITAGRSSLYSKNLYPSVTCDNTYRYTVGNGKLTYPISLMTLDEIVLAGSTSGYNPDGSSKDENMMVNTSFYLYTGQYYWSISPVYFYSSAHNIRVGDLGDRGYLSSDIAGNYNYGVRPTIALKNSTIIESGDGTSNNPYKVKMN